MRGIAYPVATHLVVDSYRNLAEHRLFRETQPNVKLEIDLAKMTATDRHQAADTLRRALKLLTQDDGDTQSRERRKPGSGGG